MASDAFDDPSDDSDSAGQPSAPSAVVPAVRVVTIDDAAPTASPSFRSFFDAHAVRVVRFAALLGAHDPEDVAQEAFCRFYERGGSGIDDPVAYLNRTVVNLVRDRHRRRSTTARWLVLARRDAEHTVMPADDVVVRGDEARQLVSALDRLPRRRREAVVLRYWLDLPYGEIAAAMGTTLGAAKSAVSRGLRDLHDHLQAHVHDEADR